MNIVSYNTIDCTGAHIVSSQSGITSLDGVVQVQGQSVERVTFKQISGSVLIGGSITFNGVMYPSDFLTLSDKKNIISINVQGMSQGNLRSVVDYPSAIDEEITWVKQ